MRIFTEAAARMGLLSMKEARLINSELHRRLAWKQSGRAWHFRVCCTLELEAGEATEGDGKSRRCNLSVFVQYKIEIKLQFLVSHKVFGNERECRTANEPKQLAESVSTTGARKSARKIENSMGSEVSRL